MTSKLTIALAGLAVASLPVLVDAQGTGTSTPQTRPEQPTTTSQQSRSGRDQNSPQHHLDEAKRVLTSVNANNVQGEARSQVNELKRHFLQLETAWRASSAGAARTGASRSTAETGTTAGSASGTTSGTATGSATGTSQGTAGTTPTEQTGTSGSQGRYPRGGSAAGNDWMTHYTAINTLLDQMIGSGTTAGASTTSGTSSGSTGSTGSTAAGTTGSASERTGTSGTPSASASAGTRIEGDARTRLMEFKRHLDQFHTAAMTQRAPGGEDASAASRSITAPATTSHETPEATAATTGTTGTMSGTAGTSGTSATMTGTAGTSGTSATMTGTAGTSGTTASASAQNPPSVPNPQTATTSQPTQPTSAAATVDSAAIARLTAAIDEMLRGGATSSTAAGTAATPTGTTATGTTATGTTATGTTSSGTAGTSGTTSSTGTVCVDRAKLEALKTQLQALQNRPR